jgi:hypothetical protein
VQCTALQTALRFSKQQIVDEGVTGSGGMKTEILAAKAAPVPLCSPDLTRTDLG